MQQERSSGRQPVTLEGISPYIYAGQYPLPFALCSAIECIRPAVRCFGLEGAEDTIKYMHTTLKKV
jgi:hypothetical protein